MTTFILEHRTPRQVQFLPASSVMGTGKGFRYSKLRRSEETLEHCQVMAALSKCIRGKPVQSGLLKVVYDEAMELYPQLMGKATYTPSQANGRPAMVTVR